jgi:hypothetical protein
MVDSYLISLGKRQLTLEYGKVRQNPGYVVSLQNLKGKKLHIGRNLPLYTWKAKVGESQVQRHPWLHSKFEASLGYIARPYQEKKGKKKKKGKGK